MQNYRNSANDAEKTPEAAKVAPVLFLGLTILFWISLAYKKIMVVDDVSTIVFMIVLDLVYIGGLSLGWRGMHLGLKKGWPMLVCAVLMVILIPVPCNVAFIKGLQEGAFWVSKVNLAMVLTGVGMLVSLTDRDAIDDGFLNIMSRSRFRRNKPFVEEKSYSFNQNGHHQYQQ